MLVVVDYGVGNLGSMAKMLRKIGADAVVSADPDAISRADRLILPGVGAFDYGMRSLEASGLIPALNKRVLMEGIPILGVCLGAQLFTLGSEEGELPGLGWLDAWTVRFRLRAVDRDLRVPHMGWNGVEVVRRHPVLADLEEECRFYFVHSYHIACNDPRIEIGRTDHGVSFVSAAGRDNILGVQFHPEKSHRFGLKLLSNFIRWT